MPLVPDRVYTFEDLVSVAPPQHQEVIYFDRTDGFDYRLTIYTGEIVAERTTAEFTFRYPVLVLLVPRVPRAALQKGLCRLTIFSFARLWQTQV